jgi:hypothetical protein
MYKREKMNTQRKGLVQKKDSDWHHVALDDYENASEILEKTSIKTRKGKIKYPYKRKSTFEVVVDLVSENQYAKFNFWNTLKAFFNSSVFYNKGVLMDTHSKKIVVYLNKSDINEIWKEHLQNLPASENIVTSLENL